MDGIPMDLAVADFNNDMRMDILVAWKTATKIRLLVYLNTGAGFEIKQNSHAFVGNGLSKIQVGDFNFDGRVDVTMFNYGGALLALNTFSQENNWIEVELVAMGVDKYAISNAKVGVVAGGIIQEKSISIQSQHKRLHFGLRNATLVSEIYVAWGPKSKVHREFGFLPNQLVTLHTPKGVTVSGHHTFDVMHARGGPHISCEPGSHRLIPSFLILGVWKAGTSSLAATLFQHPQILKPSRKEIFYFNKFYGKLPLNWYWSQFPCSDNPYHVSFEATASYLYSYQVPPLVLQYLSTARFIVMLRDPVDRVYSHFHMNARRNNFKIPQDFDTAARQAVGDFRECLSIEHNNTIYKLQNNSINNITIMHQKYVGDGCEAVDGICTLPYAAICSWRIKHVQFAAGLYYFELMHWFKYFPSLDQFYIIHFNDFVNNTDAIVSEVQAFLGLEVVSLPQQVKNISPNREPMQESTKKFLQQFYEPYNKLLYQLLGIDYGWN